MLRTEFLSRTADSRARMARIEMTLIYVLSGLLWLGAGIRVETAAAAAETAMRRLSAAPTVLTTKQEKDAAGTAGSEFRECAACPSMVVIPAGKFSMGSPEEEVDRREAEGPRHQVAIGKPLPFPSMRSRSISGMPAWRLRPARVPGMHGGGGSSP
jgi:hypothetical protein